MIDAILREINDRGVTRLCHFTRSQKLLHILAGSGIVASTLLKSNSPDEFNPTDEQRLDGQTDAVCCSVEYPNAWYLDRIKDRDPNFTDWVILTIKPEVAADENTRFCPRNAAARYGGAICDGVEGFRSLYAPSVTGTGGQTFTRTARFLSACPTDNQAEVLVGETITVDEITGMIVRDISEARRVRTQLSLAGIATHPSIYICNSCFEKVELAQRIREGRRPPETFWNGDTDE